MAERFLIQVTKEDHRGRSSVEIASTACLDDAHLIAALLASHLKQEVSIVESDTGYIRCRYQKGRFSVL